MLPSTKPHFQTIVFRLMFFGPNCRRTAEINIAVHLPYSIFVYFFSSDTCISNDVYWYRFPSPFITTLRSQSLCTSIWNYIFFGRVFDYKLKLWWSMSLSCMTRLGSQRNLKLFRLYSGPQTIKLSHKMSTNVTTRTLLRPPFNAL